MRRRAHPRVRRRARVAARGDSRHYARRRRAFRAPRVQRASPRARCRHRRVSRELARARRRASRESTRACEERDVVNDARASGMARVRARARPFARSRGRRTRVDARSRDCAIAPRRSTRVGARASVDSARSSASGSQARKHRGEKQKTEKGRRAGQRIGVFIQKEPGARSWPHFLAIARSEHAASARTR